MTCGSRCYSVGFRGGASVHRPDGHVVRGGRLRFFELLVEYCGDLSMSVP